MSDNSTDKTYKNSHLNINKKNCSKLDFRTTEIKKSSLNELQFELATFNYFRNFSIYISYKV